MSEFVYVRGKARELIAVREGGTWPFQLPPDRLGEIVDPFDLVFHVCLVDSVQLSLFERSFLLNYNVI